MKCRYCRKKVRSISHFMKTHKALMLRKSRAGRRKKRSPSSRSRKARSAVKTRGGIWKIPRGSGSITIRIG